MAIGRWPSASRSRSWLRRDSLHHRLCRRSRTGGRADAARTGARVVVHARNRDRLTAVRDLLDRGAMAVVGDLSNLEETRGVAGQVNRLGQMDAVIHNAGVLSGPNVLPVNVGAPYLLTALIHRPEAAGLPQQRHAPRRSSQPDRHRLERPPRDKLLFGQQALRHHARRCRRPDLAGRVQQRGRPGWVPTRMGGPGAPDDLRLGHLTQEWLATSDDPEARTSGGYWHHQRRVDPARSVHDQRFQGQLLQELASFTGTPLSAPVARRAERWHESGLVTPQRARPRASRDGLTFCLWRRRGGQ